MDFEMHYTAEQETFRGEVSTWLEENLPKVPARPDMNLLTDEELAKGRAFRRKLGERGWYAPTWPTEYGGGGLSVEHAIIIAEELNRLKEVTPAVYDVGLSLASPALAVWGTEEQKQRWLRPILTGESVSWQLFSEPGAGSDLASLQCRAVRDGDEYVINGQKLWNGSHQPPEHFYLLAMTDPDGPRHNNIGAFFFDVDRPGITITPVDCLCYQKNGIFFDDVRIPADSLIGGETDGWRVGQSTLEIEHGGGGNFIGYGAFVYEAIELCKTFERNGQPLSKDPSVARALVDLYIDAQVGRLFNMRNYWNRSTRTPNTYEGAQNSLYGKRMGPRVARTILSIMGPHALTDDPKWALLNGNLENEQRQAINTHAAGTPEIQQLIMARRLGLGRPAEQAAETV